MTQRMTQRIVQLSDPHLTTRVGGRVWGTDTWRNLMRVLDRLRDQAPVDLLVLTGDLANRPRRKIYQRLDDVLADWRDRLYLLPGNHDDPAMLRSVFEDRWTAEPPTGGFVHHLAGWRLIGFDSTVRWRLHGRLGSEPLAWLRDELREPQPTLLFLHHLPVRIGIWWLDRDQLRDRVELARIVSGSTVQGIFCGHVHQPREVPFAGCRVLTSPSTAYQFAPGAWLPYAASRIPAWRVIELRGDRMATRIERLAE